MRIKLHTLSYIVFELSYCQFKQLTNKLIGVFIKGEKKKLMKYSICESFDCRSVDTIHTDTTNIVVHDTKGTCVRAAAIVQNECLVQRSTAQQQKHCTDTAAPHSHRRLHLHAIYTYKLYQVYNVEAVASLVNGRSFFRSCCYCCCRRYTSTTCTTSTGLCVLLFYEIPSPADVMRRNKQLFLKQTNNNNRSSAFLCVVACESFCLMNEKRHQ